MSAHLNKFQKFVFKLTDVKPDDTDIAMIYKCFDKWNLIFTVAFHYQN
jgi:hypothetical protein